MGLSSFNRMRRERAKVEKIEAERFKADNEARHAARKMRDGVKGDAELREKAAQAEHEAVEAIGEKNRAGLETNDLPLRQDHAAEIAGRNINGVQEPKDPVARIDERIPDNTPNEKLVEHMSAEDEGPAPALVEAAQEEAGVIARRPRAAETPESRAAVNVPADWQSLSWQERRSLASQLSDDPITNGEQANAAIEAELKRRQS
jgi:hypothetical protein